MKIKLKTKAPATSRHWPFRITYIPIGDILTRPDRISMKLAFPHRNVSDLGCNLTVVSDLRHTLLNIWAERPLDKAETKASEIIGHMIEQLKQEEYEDSIKDQKT